MKNKSIKTLEFNKITEILSTHCVSKQGKKRALRLLPSDSSYEIRRMLEQVDEGMKIVLRNGRIPMAEIYDVTDAIKRAEIQSVLSMEELLYIGKNEKLASEIRNYFFEDVRECEDCRLLSEQIELLSPCSNLHKSILKKIISPTEMVDNASRELHRIRREIQIKNNRIKEKLNHIITSGAHQKHLQDHIVTIRNNRYVVPVKLEYRQAIPGIVQDQSSTGATLYIEPASVVNLNNDLKMLDMEEEKEIYRILKELSNEVAMYAMVLKNNIEIMTDFDFIFGKVNYALAINAIRPEIKEGEGIAFYQASHPLIDSKEVVKSDIYLNKNIKTMVVTGPNTGGKTVTLKTIGLLSLMVQAGLFIPVQTGSYTRIFDHILADIGDEQSIEQSLSTFSSHMKNIVEILEIATRNSLVLFDELGAGTDPTEGAALAMAILNSLYSRKVTTVATTHYTELKEYALTKEGVENASVEFDVETLMPTYRLLIGIPGKSNAFEISKRLGLKEEVIDSAREMIDYQTIRFEDTLKAIEEQRKTTEENYMLSQRVKEEAEKQQQQLEKIETELETKRETMLEKAREEAQQLVEDAKKETDALYKEIQALRNRSLSDKSINQQIEKMRRDVRKKEEKLQSGQKQVQSKNSGVKITDLKPGMDITLLDVNRKASVIKILPKENKVMVQAGIMRMKTDLNNIRIEKPAQQVKPQKGSKYKKNYARYISTKLDLRGKNKEEAIDLTEKYLDDVVMAGLHEVQIVHGKGEGILSRAIQEYLKNHRQVESFAFGKPQEGGTGVTIVKL
jgi:DNA mismatch repair protein MutS2